MVHRTKLWKASWHPCSPVLVAHTDGHWKKTHGTFDFIWFLVSWTNNKTDGMQTTMNLFSDCLFPKKTDSCFVQPKTGRFWVIWWYGKYPIIYKAFYIPTGLGFQPPTVPTFRRLNMFWNLRVYPWDQRQGEPVVANGWGGLWRWHPKHCIDKSFWHFLFGEEILLYVSFLRFGCAFCS